MKNVIWFDGKFVPQEKAQVPLLSHALHYGTSVFEGIRAYRTEKGAAIFRLNDHVDRLFRSAAMLGMRMPYTKSAIARAIRETVSRNGLRECYIRPIVFYGEGQIRIAPQGARLRVAIAAWSWDMHPGGHKTLSVCVSPYIRFHPASIAPGAKIGGYYVTSALAIQDARARGFDECILLDHEGNVAEGPVSNIFAVKKGRLITPLSPSILPGITRESVFALAKDMKIPVSEKKMSLAELLRADEVFLVGTAVEVAPVGKINGKKIGTGATGPVSVRMAKAFDDAARGISKKHKAWRATV